MLTKVHARLCGGILAAALSMGLVASAEAASLNMTSFGRTELAKAHAARADFLDKYDVSDLRSESFEDRSAWNGSRASSNPGQTSVGKFSTLGGTGHGGSAINGGTNLEVRGDNDMKWGRYDANGLGGKWLDSNDTLGMKWEISGVGKFNALSFFLIDAADAGGKFSLKVGDTLYSQVLGGKGATANGNIQLVTILLPKAVSNLTVKLFHDRLNDGFGIDGASVANIAPVPVPPAAALLVTGLMALGIVRRRRAAA